MRRLMGFVFFFLCGSLGGFAQGPGHARVGDTFKLARMKRGAHIDVRSIASTQFADVDERCRFVSLDADVLTCNADDDRHVRLVFPIAKVQAVYRIHRTVSVGAILAGAVVGTLIGGLAAACGPAIAVGGFGTFIGLFVLIKEAQDHTWRMIWGIPDPPPEPAERLTLVYQG